MNKSKAREFAKKWKTRGDEKQDTQQFWIQFFRDVLEIDSDSLDFEKRSAKQTRGNNFIDAYVNAGDGKKTIIEQKSRGIDLEKRAQQSDGTLKSPVEQAINYDNQLAFSERANFIITCNFDEFLFYNLERTGKQRFEPIQRIKLEELGQYPDAFNMLIPDSREASFNHEVAVSVKATEYITGIYKLLEESYKRAEPGIDRSEDLNKLAVRLVFLLYAEDAGLLIHQDRQTDFWDYLKDLKSSQIRRALIDLFNVLNTPISERDPYIEPELSAMPYVNGGLFKDKIVIPNFSEEMKETLKHASLEFDWTAISPTIFGAMFESTLNPVTRRSGGMHYTSIENIHKVINPLFLDDLTAELEKIRDHKVGNWKGLNNQRDEIIAFQEKLSSIKILDPAMGSGNFLTESYLSLRRLENEALMILNSSSDGIHHQIMDFLDGEFSPIRVSLDQFYGIEINDFAVAVANVAIVLAEHQMMRETEKIIGQELEFLPLKSHSGFHEGNALRMDWNKVVPAEELNYIIGNPPFVGYNWQSPKQRKDMAYAITGREDKKLFGKPDYVVTWYFKTADYIKSKPSIQAAFVSTNSITQGEQITSVWQPLIEDKGVKINFAYPAFIWNNSTKDQAHVHVVIIGFGLQGRPKKMLYKDGIKKEVKHISPFLIESQDLFLPSRSKPLYPVPALTRGNQPTDGGFLTIKDKEAFLKQEPGAEKFIKKFWGAEEFINKKEKWCLWLVDASPSEIRKYPTVLKRVEDCREYRKKGGPDCQKLVSTPTRFRESKNPERYLLIPQITSERREYIPFGYMDGSVIPSNKAVISTEAELYHFGVLESMPHMLWTKTVCGRLKSDYQYSIKIVYNNFPWPEPTEKQKAEIEKTAQAILDARDLYPDSSLADLYDPLTMPPELIKAHQANDRAVMKAYGFKHTMGESEILAKLFELYQKKVENIN